MTKTKYNKKALSDFMNDINTLYLTYDPSINLIDDIDLFYDALCDLNDMIGMYDVKEHIIKRIKTLLVNTYDNVKNQNNENKFGDCMFHTVVYGAPGTGKTSVCECLAKLWKGIGLKKKKIINTNTSIDNILAKYSFPSPSEKSNKSSNNNYLDPPKTSYLDPPKIISNTDHGNKLKTLYEQCMIAEAKRFLYDKPYKYPDSSSYKYSDPSSYKYSDPLSYKYSDPLSYKYPDPLSYKYPDSSSYKYPDSSSYKYPDSSSYKYPDLSSYKYPDSSSYKSTESKDLVKNTNASIDKLNVLRDASLEPKIYDSKKSFRTPLVRKYLKSPIKKVSREDVIASYLGQSTEKTIKLLNNALKNGEVILFDEFYSIISDSKDSYGIDALNVINRFMSEHPELPIIFAGYKEKILDTIFKVQPGFKSRCKFIFEIKDVNGDMLANIFIKNIIDNSWIFNEKNNDDLISFFNNNMKYFDGFGRDVITFVEKCQESVSEKYFNSKLKGNFLSMDKNITMEIINETFENEYKKHIDSLNEDSDKDFVNKYMMYA